MGVAGGRTTAFATACPTVFISSVATAAGLPSSAFVSTITPTFPSSHNIVFV